MRSFVQSALPLRIIWLPSRAKTTAIGFFQLTAATAISLVCHVSARLCARAELKNVTVHTLRHSFAAAAAELGFSELTIAGLLGHTVPGVTARYAHVPDTALLAAADRVSERIATALDGSIAKAGVVQLSEKPRHRIANAIE